MIYGNIICQNGLPDLLRAIESIYPLCDEIYICDGYSTDGTWEWLQNVKKSYNLKLYQNKFITMADQRNFLLSKTPIDSWIISIDQDEQLHGGEYLLETFNEVKPDRLVSVSLPILNLKDDMNHCVEFIYFNGNKIFYNQEGVHFGINHYHAILTSKHGGNWREISVPSFIFMKHYALLDQRRNKLRCKRLKNNKEAGLDEYNFYCKNKHKVIELPKGLK